MADFDMTPLGDTLRAERMRRGMDLAALSKETKIRRNILEAIERNQFDCMPAGAYRPSFLRQYAHAVGLDEAEAIAAFHQQYGEEPDLPLPTPPKRTRPWPVLELAWLLVAAGALVGVHKIAESIHAIPIWKGARMAQMGPPTAPAKTHSSKPVAAPPPVPDSGAPSDKAADTNPPVRVVFTATEPVWMSVKCDGNPSYTGTLIGPETKAFEASSAVSAMIGNAGGVAISLNGKSIGPIGAHGETKSLELTPSGAHTVPRSAKTESKPENPN
jgi:cytoskeleton protein RodZ